MLLTILIYIQSFAFAQVTMTETAFDVPPGSGTHYWSATYDWKAWEKTKFQKELNLSARPVGDVYNKRMFGGESWESLLGEAEGYKKNLTLTSFKDKFKKVYGGDKAIEAQRAYEFYQDKNVVFEEEDVTPVEDEQGEVIQKGVVVASKTQVDLGGGFDLDAINMANILKWVQISDRPHLHVEVGYDFAKKFVDPIHKAHASLDAHKSTGKFVLSTINTGDQYYNCSFLNHGLILQARLLPKLPVEDDSYRSHMIGIFDEVKKDKGLPFLPKRASKTFVQKIVFSANLVKEAVNYFSFTPSKNGGWALTVQSFLVVTDKVKISIPFIDPFSIFHIGETNNEVKLGDDGVFIANPNLITLNRISDKTQECSSGLGQGVLNYTYNLALDFAAALEDKKQHE